MSDLDQERMQKLLDDDILEILAFREQDYEADSLSQLREEFSRRDLATKDIINHRVKRLKIRSLASECVSCGTTVGLKYHQLVGGEFECHACGTCQPVLYPKRVEGIDAEEVPPVRKDLSGVRGWLIFLAVTIVIPLLDELYVIIVGWDKLTVPAATYFIADVVVLSVIIILLFTKNFLFPRVIISYFVLSLIVALAFQTNFSGGMRGYGALFRILIFGGVWSWYILTSQRVKDTYCRTRGTNEIH